MKRTSAIIISILGIACLALGVVFIMQAGTAEQKVADDIAPLALDQVNAKYGQVTAAQEQIRDMEEPGIQAGTAAPSDTYNYLTAQRTGLAVARTNIGLAQFIRTSGILNIVIGAGLVLAGMVLFQKDRAVA